MPTLASRALPSPRSAGLHLGIDASNIRQGGGITHLSQLLDAADPQAAGIDRVTAWVWPPVAAALPKRPWLRLRASPWLEARLPLRMLGQLFALPGELRAAGCDVLFSPGGTLPPWSPVPTVTMSQNMLPFEPSEADLFGRWSPMRAKMHLLRLSQARSFRSAGGLIFLTEYARSAVSSAMGGSTGRSALIPHGIEPRFRIEPRPQRRLEDCSVARPLRLLYVSILMPYKHQYEVASAVAQLRAQGLPVEITFIGAPWGQYGRNFPALIARLDPAGAFLHWTGAQPFDTLHLQYQDADAFVFASSCENLPNILIEAMAAGLPIACSDRGPMPEVLGGAGVYFDPGQPSSIADALRLLAGDAALRARIAALAGERAKPYLWERCARDTLAFIADVATNHG